MNTIFYCLWFDSTENPQIVLSKIESSIKNTFVSAAVCHLKCSLSQFNCNCEMNSSVTDQLPRVCIPRTSLCDGWQDCEDGSDEIDCTCPPDQYQCGCDVGGNCFANAIYECKGPGYFLMSQTHIQFRE